MNDPIHTYLESWQAVQEIERGELTNASYELRWLQHNALTGMAHQLGIHPQRDVGQEDIEFQRWALIKQKSE